MSLGFYWAYLKIFIYICYESVSDFLSKNLWKYVTSLLLFVPFIFYRWFYIIWTYNHLVYRWQNYDIFILDSVFWLYYNWKPICQRIINDIIINYVVPPGVWVYLLSVFFCGSSLIHDICLLCNATLLMQSTHFHSFSRIF